MNNHFPELDLKFFQRHGFGDPHEMMLLWEAFIQRPHKPEAMYRKCLEIAAGVADGVVRNWLSKDAKRFLHIRWGTVFLFHDVTQALANRGFAHDLPRQLSEEPAFSKRRSRARRLALFANLQAVSDVFFLEVVRGIATACAARNLALSIHEMPTREVELSFERTLARFEPDGVVMLRITPTPKTLEKLSLHQIPLVLVHADRLAYAPPTITNIIPNLIGIDKELKRWLAACPCLRRNRRAKVVMVGMPYERPRANRPLAGGAARASLRNERKDKIREALKHLNAELFEVKDYNFRHAWDVWARYGREAVYVCLSDQLAVALKQLMRAVGVKDWKHRVIGFDDSRLAQEESIASFSQDLCGAGTTAVAGLCEFFRNNRGRNPQWPEFYESFSMVRLVKH